MNDLVQKTLQFLKKDPQVPRQFLLIEPHLLYLSDKQSQGYLKAMQNPRYASGFHNPTIEIIEKNLEKMFDRFGGTISFIDLGPGYPDKSLPIAKYFRTKGWQFNYYPVDVSSEFLKITVGAMQPYASQVVPIHSLFENCTSKIPHEVYQNNPLCSIGLTFMNFESNLILPLLRTISGVNGYVMIASELLTEAKTERHMIEQYNSEELSDFTFGPLKNMGVDKKVVSYGVAFQNHRVEMFYRFIENPPDFLKKKGMARGSKIVVAISYRYTRDDLGNLLSKYFKTREMFFSQDRGTVVALCK